MPQCFIIQPFDNGGRFDRRFKETFMPAIEKAGFKVYRVDYDPSVSIPIEGIEEGIRSSDVCFADVTLPNPNVWFEVGFALAAKRDVVLVCQEGAYQHYPFDVQHRRVIAYSGESISDFERLAARITERFEAIKSHQDSRPTLAGLPALKETSGLSAHEVSALVLTVQKSIVPADDAIGAWELKHEMERSGYTEAGTTVAVHKLIRRRFIEQVKRLDRRENEEYTGYVATPNGIEWILANEDKLQLRFAPEAKTGTDDILF